MESTLRVRGVCISEDEKKSKEVSESIKSKRLVGEIQNLERLSGRASSNGHPDFLGEYLKTNPHTFLGLYDVMKLMDSSASWSSSTTTDSNKGIKSIQKPVIKPGCEKKSLSLSDFLKLEHDVCTSSHTVVVHTFHPNVPEYHVRVPESCLIVDLKYQLSKYLRLRNESMDCFGFFRGKTGAPVAYVPDHFPVKHFKDLWFQRLCTVPDLEVITMQSDPAALEMIYYEMSYMVYNERLASQHPTLLQILRYVRTNETASQMALFLENLQTFSTSYSMLYHQANYCAFLQPFEIEGAAFDKGECIHVGLNIYNMVLFDDEKDFMHNIHWEKIKQVKYNPTNRIVKFQVWTNDHMATLALKSMQHELLFTLAVFFIKTCETMFSVHSDFRQVPDMVEDYFVFWNDMCCFDADPALSEHKLHVTSREEHKLRITRMEAQEDSSITSDDEITRSLDKKPAIGQSVRPAHPPLNGSVSVCQITPSDLELALKPPSHPPLTGSVSVVQITPSDRELALKEDLPNEDRSCLNDTSSPNVSGFTDTRSLNEDGKDSNGNHSPNENTPNEDKTCTGDGSTPNENSPNENGNDGSGSNGNPSKEDTPNEDGSGVNGPQSLNNNESGSNVAPLSESSLNGTLNGANKGTIDATETE